MDAIKCLDQANGDAWVMYNGDACELIKGIPDDSIGFSVFSPPFSSLYTYSNSDRDMGNSDDDAHFLCHFTYLIEDLYRVMMPGRNLSIHCMNLPTLKTHHGYIGLRDFRGDIIRAFQKAGFIFHSEVCVWKDPVTAMQRTKAIGLLHKQVLKDSAMSRQAIPDYVVTFTKPGTNLVPVSGPFDSFAGEDFQHVKNLSIDIWQRYASPVWMDIRSSRTLQYTTARDEEDERHICPLQLDVIERCMQLWSIEGDSVLSPFGGIGSEGHVAVTMGRRFVGFELKPSYYRVACKNLRIAEQSIGQGLFESVAN